MSDEVKTLRGVFKKKAEESHKENSSTFLLLDASGSISGQDFQVAQQAACAFLGCLGPEALVAVAQFSDGCMLECPLTKDHELARFRTLGMRRHSGGTDTAAGLAFARSTLTVASGIKTLYLFTDGYPNDQNAAIREGQALRNMGVNIIGIGIGNLDRSKIEQVCGSQTYIVNDFHTLLQAMPTVSRKPYVPYSEVQYTFEQTKSPIGFKENLPLRIIIKNASVENVVAAGAILTIEGGDFYDKKRVIIKESIPHDGTKQVDVVLEVTGNANPTILPNEIKVSLMEPKTQLEYESKHDGFHVELSSLVKDIVQWKCPESSVETANILVFGATGAGKSTLVNHLLSLWKDSVEKLAASWNSEDHVTLQGKQYHEVSGFRFHDTVGLSDDNYELTEFEGIVNGCLPIEYEVNTANKRSIYDEISRGAAEAGEREIHSIIFVLPQGFRFFQSNNMDKIKRFREFVQKAVRMRYSPLLVVTRMDEVEPEEHPQILKVFSQISGFAPRDIYLMDNSEESDEKDIRKDRLAYQVLRKALDYATSFAKMKGPSPSPSPVKGSPSSKSSTPQKPVPTSSGSTSNSPSRVVLEDMGEENDLFDIQPGISMDELRKAIEEQLEKVHYEFVHPETGRAIKRPQEKKVLLSAYLVPGKETRVKIVSTPPAY